MTDTQVIAVGALLPRELAERAADVLPGAQFRDVFGIIIGRKALTARQAADAVFGRSPFWIRGLMGARNLIVAPFGLKRPRRFAKPDKSRVGAFPILEESADRLLAGLDDRHLDFRVIVEVKANHGTNLVTVTSLVCTHNLLGRLYLGCVAPFHRRIVPALLRRLAGVDAQDCGMTSRAMRNELRCTLPYHQRIPPRDHPDRSCITEEI